MGQIPTKQELMDMIELVRYFSVTLILRMICVETLNFRLMIVI